MWRKSKIICEKAKFRYSGLIHSIWFGLVIGLVATSVAKSADPSLVGWWKFDESSGNIAYDSSGYDNNGTIYGNPQWVPGKFEGALAFDGNGDYVNCGNSPELQIQDQITIAFWIKVEKFTRDWQTVIAKGNNSYRMGRPQWSNAMHLGIQGTTSSPYPWFDGKKAVADNQWHHVAGVYDGTQGIIYIDGVLDAAQAATGQINASDFNLYIGENEQATGRYWNGLIDDVRLYNRALSQTEIQQVILNIPPSLSSNPNPEDKETDVPRDVILSWKPGEYADKHDVYFGTVFDDVNDASITEPLDMLVSQDQELNTYDPDGLLDFGQTYYWRVDEVNAPPNETVCKGNVWSFTVEPFTYPIENIIVSASSFQREGREPENTINGSGLDDNDLHSTDNATMWLTSTTPQSVWIQYEFDKTYKLHQMWVWNFNSQFEYLLGFGFKDVTVEYSENGTDWTTLGDFEFAQGTSANDYAHNTTVDFNGIVAKYVKLTAHSNWSGKSQYGLSEIRFLYKPVLARQPNPASGQTGVTPDAVLSWRAGREAASHELYFSSDMQAVIDGTAFVGTVSQHSYDLSPLDLELGKTYYWKINEVNEAESPASWEGDVWSFTVLPYLLVDDFEGYDYNNKIYDTWTDYFVNNTGMTVGYFDPPHIERVIVHGGSQSMYMRYDNDGTVNEGTDYEQSGTLFYSEAEREWMIPQDWTRKGVNVLTLWFRGLPGSLGSFTLGPPITMTGIGADIAGMADQFHFAYKRLSGAGSITANVVSLTNTDPWAKAGVMIRESLEPDSVNVMIAVTPDNGVTFQSRNLTGNDSVSIEQTDITAPQWVRLTRSGNTFTGQYSANGSNWTTLGSVDIPMLLDAYIGLCVTSHNVNAICTAEFSDVTTTGSVTGDWQSQDIGIENNAPEQLYVALQDSAGNSAVVNHPDSAATTIDTWTQWSIPLKDFSGVNLQAVTKMSIGVGNRANPQAGGAGDLYIDDIELYLP
jgi:regulation of enolase protein 1 (concanavalin A-like superfamily)